MPKTYDRQTAAFIAKVAESMPDIPGDVMQGWMENPKSLARVLKDLHPWHGQEPWKFACALSFIKEAKRKSEIFKKVSDGSLTLGYWGEKLFAAAFTKTPTFDTVWSTVRVKLCQLGITEPVTLRDLKKRARQFGLVECPHFIAYHYRLRYEKQPLNEWLYLLTESVDIGGGELSLFGLTHLQCVDSKNPQNPLTSCLWLDGHYGQEDFKWNPDAEWIFALK